jgi:hypothetical protein
VNVVACNRFASHTHQSTEQDNGDLGLKEEVVMMTKGAQVI